MKSIHYAAYEVDLGMMVFLTRHLLIDIFCQAIHEEIPRLCMCVEHASHVKQLNIIRLVFLLHYLRERSRLYQYFILVA